MIEDYIGIVLSIIVVILSFYYYKKKNQLFQLCVGFYFVGAIFIQIFPNYFYLILGILGFITMYVFFYWLYKRRRNV